jgi:hypothetical protein
MVVGFTTTCAISAHHHRARVMLFNVTFNKISVIWWRSVLLMEETGVPGENIMLFSDMILIFDNPL